MGPNPRPGLLVSVGLGLQWLGAGFPGPHQSLWVVLEGVLSLRAYTTRDQGPGLACRLCRDEFPH